MKRLGGCILAFSTAFAAAAEPLLTVSTPTAVAPAPALASPLDDLAQGLMWLYHLRYDKAIEFYDRYIAAHPDDPAGYFYKAAADWWHLAQNFEYPLPDIQKRFDVSVDAVIEKSQKRIEKLESETPDQPHERALTYLYWGGAEGLRGRWLVTQKHWAQAYFSGRRGYLMLQKSLKLDPTLYDAYMGIGIYDYFSDTLSGFMGFLSAVFVRGDRKRGIEALNLAIQKSPHARVEAQIFLSEIYIFEEKTPEKAETMVSSLRQEFPNSPLMHLLQITLLYREKKWTQVAAEAQDYFEKSQKETPWYNKQGMAPALYCLGVADMWGKADHGQALEKFNQVLAGAEEADPSRWISFAHLRRGQLYDLKHQRDKAEADYHFVLGRPDIWGSHREAKSYLKEPFNGTSLSE